MHYLATIVASVVAFFGGLLAPIQQFGVSIITTNSSDTLTTFRTNTNTNLNNLNAAIIGIVSTSSAISLSQVLYATGVNTMAGVATTSETCSSGVTCTAHAVLTGGGAITLSPIAANSALVNQTSASGVPSALATSSLYTLGSGLVQSSTLFQQKENRSFSYATTTAWVGTTTIALGVAYGEVWNTIKCYTNAGTLNVHFGYGTASTTMFNASTTIGTITATPNNTMTSGGRMAVDIGTPASSPTVISCTVNDTI